MEKITDWQISYFFENSLVFTEKYIYLCESKRNQCLTKNK